MVVEFRATLAVALQQSHKRRGLTRETAAERIGTSPAQVSKMEAGQGAIPIDRLIQALASLGESSARIAKALGPGA